MLLTSQTIKCTICLIIGGTVFPGVGIVNGRSLMIVVYDV